MSLFFVAPKDGLIFFDAGFEKWGNDDVTGTYRLGVQGATVWVGIHANTIQASKGNWFDLSGVERSIFVPFKNIAR